MIVWLNCEIVFLDSNQVGHACLSSINNPMVVGYGLVILDFVALSWFWFMLTFLNCLFLELDD